MQSLHRRARLQNSKVFDETRKIQKKNWSLRYKFNKDIIKGKLLEKYRESIFKELNNRALE